MQSDALGADHGGGPAARLRWLAGGVVEIGSAPDAQDLPLPDDRLDAAVRRRCAGSPTRSRPCRRSARVLRRGGALHVLEDGLAPDEGVVRWQRRATGSTAGPRGCVLDRDVPALLGRPASVVTALETYGEPGADAPVGLVLRGPRRGLSTHYRARSGR